MAQKSSFALGFLLGVIATGIVFGFMYRSAKSQLAITIDRLSEVENFSVQMEKMRDGEAKRALKAEKEGWHPCISTIDIPGVRHEAMFYVREWPPSVDGSCDWGYSPRQIYEGVPVLGSDYAGGSLGCKNIDATVSWHPRRDGFCYPLDMPK